MICLCSWEVDSNHVGGSAQVASVIPLLAKFLQLSGWIYCQCNLKDDKITNGDGKLDHLESWIVILSPEVVDQCETVG